jgi:hypothetical protein
MRLSNKSHKDVFGFIRTEEYLSQERQHHATRIDMSAQLDVDWVEHLKSIGGPVNLKPYASFRPSPELKQLVRRGIPVALRPLIWPFISRTDQYRRQYDNIIYEELVQRSSELEQRVKDDIEKDLERYAIKSYRLTKRSQQHLLKYSSILLLSGPSQSTTTSTRLRPSLRCGACCPPWLSSSRLSDTASP